jgi:hypothetical protein
MLRRMYLGRVALNQFAPPPSLAEVVAAIRAHSVDGPSAIAGTNSRAPHGLQLPPRPSGGSVVTVDSLAELEDAINDLSDRDIELVSGAYTGEVWAQAAGRGGNRVRLQPGVVWTAPDGDTPAITVFPSYTGPLEFMAVDRSQVLILGSVYLARVNGQRPSGGLWFTNLTLTGRNTAAGGSTGQRNADGCIVNANGVVFQGCDMTFSGGCLFVEGGTTNWFVHNCRLTSPNLADLEHENPIRSNGGDLGVVSHVRTRTYRATPAATGCKHGLRQHAAYNPDIPGGRLYVRDWLAIGKAFMGTTFTGMLSHDPQSTYLSMRGVRGYPDASLAYVDIDAPWLNLDGEGHAEYIGDVVNHRLELEDVRMCSSDHAPGSLVMSGSNVPPGNTSDAVFVALSDPPSWEFLHE